MAIYAIGDLQGCYQDLLRLLEQIEFDPAADRLWFTGDLISRGPESLQCLRFVSSLGDAAVSVLGNHDLHFLALAENAAPKPNNKPMDPGLREILDADDAGTLLHWLRHRPLAHHENGILLIHAGLAPQWSVELALQLAAEAEAVLRGPGYREFFKNMYGDLPDRWDPGLAGHERTRFIVNCLTRLRCCDPQGRLLLAHKESPAGLPESILPWFRVPGRASRGARIVFGHWSTLGLAEEDGVQCLDSGCVWGGQLSAVRLDRSGPVVSVQCPAYQAPG
ncbi:MAG: symmetrical bis(5'-nucleosyl)-tetraphosphatase [Proteobacteria bacterium]|nr:symmetrical bis(5'-nucleosyl)-tetraphosphatase [Pseudomonadota bacterium]